VPGTGRQRGQRIDQDHGVFEGTLPAERRHLRGNTFLRRALCGSAASWPHRPTSSAGEVGLRQATRQLGIHRDAITAAFARWELPPPSGGWAGSPASFLSDRAEAERAFQLAERLGSVRDGETPSSAGPFFRRVIS
jgi:hypothetical protein